MSRTSSRILFTVAVSLAAWGLFTASVYAMREPLALNDYTAIWGLKAHAFYRTGSLASLFRVDPEGAFSHPEYPPLWPLVLTTATRGWLPFDDLDATFLWPLLVIWASLFAARAAWRGGAGVPFALLAAAAVSLLPYWRRYPGYAEGLLLVFVLGAAGNLARAGESALATVRLSVFLTLAAWTKPEGLVAALAAAAALALARRARAAIVVALSALLFCALPWALVVRLLAPGPLPTAFALDAFSFSKAWTALSVLVSEAAPAAGLVVAGLLILLLSRETLRRRRTALVWTGLWSLALVLSYAFSRFDPAWHVRWSWDRVLVVPLAALIPVLAEALAECAGDRSAQGPLPASPAAFPPPAPGPER